MENDDQLRRDSVFISHIGNESPVALRLKRHIQDVLGADIPVFVSSDYESIRSGEEWYRRIVDTIASSKVVIVLISTESVDRPWINFEAGVGIGSRCKVFPIAIRGFKLGDLKPPLQALHARDIHDPNSVIAIIRDVGEAIQRTPIQFDPAGFVDAIKEIERLLSYKGIILKPFVGAFVGDGAEINFELSNTGNQDLEPVEIEVFIPDALLSSHGMHSFDSNYIATSRVNDNGVRYFKMTYKIYEGTPNVIFGVTEPLPRLFTTSMQPRVFKSFRARIRSNLNEVERSMVIRYQVHVKGFRTEMNELSVGELLSRKEVSGRKEKGTLPPQRP